MMYRWLSCNLKHAGVSIHMPRTGDGGKKQRTEFYLQNVVFTQIGMDEVAVLVHSSGRNDQFCVQIG